MIAAISCRDVLAVISAMASQRLATLPGTLPRPAREDPFTPYTRYRVLTLATRSTGSWSARSRRRGCRGCGWRFEGVGQHIIGVVPNQPLAADQRLPT